MSINFKNAASAAVSACGGFGAGPGATSPGETGPEKQEPSIDGMVLSHRSRSAPARVPPRKRGGLCCGLVLRV
jgi:hypothetical protein